MPKMLYPRVYVPLLMLLLLLAAPFLLSDYLNGILTMIFLFATCSSAWNWIGGYGGQFSLGHAAYFGVGAYTSTMLVHYFQISPWIGLVAGGCVAMLLSLVVGLACFRLRGPYFVISTIAMGEVMRLIFLRERGITLGGVGISVPFMGNSPLFFQWSSKQPYYYVALIMMLIVIYITFRMERSKLGYYLSAIGQNHDAAEAIGIDSARVKQLVLLMSAFATAAAGTFYAQYMYFIDPDSVFGGALSNEFALVGMIGGMGTVFGPILGSFVLRPLIELTQVWLGSTYSGVHLIVYGGLLMIMVLWRPSGLIGFAEIIYGRLLTVLPRPREALGGGKSVASS